MDQNQAAYNLEVKKQQRNHPRSYQKLHTYVLTSFRELITEAVDKISEIKLGKQKTGKKRGDNDMKTSCCSCAFELGVIFNLLVPNGCSGTGVAPPLPVIYIGC